VKRPAIGHAFDARRSGLLARVVQRRCQHRSWRSSSLEFCWGRWLTGPFDGMFTFREARVAVAVNCAA
jgi:hypothetical protein